MKRYRAARVVQSLTIATHVASLAVIGEAIGRFAPRLRAGLADSFRD